MLIFILILSLLNLALLVFRLLALGALWVSNDEEHEGCRKMIGALVVSMGELVRRVGGEGSGGGSVTVVKMPGDHGGAN